MQQLTNIKISASIYLTQIKKEDKPSLIKYINDKDIYNNTLKIPYPYTEQNADEWIDCVEYLKIETGVLKHWAIKNNYELIGGIGFHNKYGTNSHKDEIGYWLAKPFRNKGIMTGVIKNICSLGFNDFKLLRIEATVFSSNISSQKVLGKAGFIKEGLLKNFYLKDEKLINAYVYSLLA